MFNAESTVSRTLEISVNKNMLQIGGKHIPQASDLSSESKSSKSVIEFDLPLILYTVDPERNT